MENLKVINYKIDILKRALFKNKHMSSFPLYDNLKNDLPKKDLTIKQKEELINCVLKMDSNAKELIYVLIQQYNSEYNTGKFSDDIPFNAIKKQNSDTECDISWSLTDIPIQLRQLLYKFMLLHIKNKAEEINRDF